jgi:hypothetical protein
MHKTLSPNVQKNIFEKYSRTIKKIQLDKGKIPLLLKLKGIAIFVKF